MNRPYTIIPNTCVGPFILGMHFQTLLKEFPNLKNEPTATIYLRFVTKDGISLYVDRETNNLIGIKISEKFSAHYLGVSIGSSKSDVKKLQPRPFSPGIQIKYVDNTIDEILVFVEHPNQKIVDLTETVVDTKENTLSLIDTFHQIKGYIPLLIIFLLLILLFFGSLQQSKQQLAMSPSFTIKQVVATSSDHYRLSFTLNVHPKNHSDQVRNFHKMIRTKLRDQVATYISKHTKKELYLFNNGISLSINMSNFLNKALQLNNTSNELVVKKIRIKG